MQIVSIRQEALKRSIGRRGRHTGGRAVSGNSSQSSRCLHLGIETKVRAEDVFVDVNESGRFEYPDLEDLTSSMAGTSTPHFRSTLALGVGVGLIRPSCEGPNDTG